MIIAILLWIISEIAAIGLYYKFYRHYFIVGGLPQKFFMVIFVIFSGICGYYCSSYIGQQYDMGRLMVAYAVLSIAALIDAQTQIIPNALVLILIGTRLIYFVADVIKGDEDSFSNLLWTLAFSVVVFILLCLLAAISKNGIGMGDIKLISALSLLCGLRVTIFTLICALAVCVVISVIMIAQKKKTIKEEVAFGPYIMVGYILSIMMGVF